MNAAESYIGDIAISPQTAARNARGSLRTLQAELRILILHGMIHLAGYDHETDHGEMTRLEMSLRRRLNVLGNETRTARSAQPEPHAQTKSTAQPRPARSSSAAPTLMGSFLYTIGILSLSAILVVFAYLDRIYRELGRVTGGVLHQHLDIFEADIEPRLHLERRRAGTAFAMLAQLTLIAVAVVTAHGVLQSVPESGSAVVLQLLVYLIVETILFAQFIPYMLLARTQGSLAGPVCAALCAYRWLITWPLRAMLDLAISVAHISDEEISPRAESPQEGIEALVEVAQEEGILASDEAQLIEQVVEFSDKRVLEVMTPRPDIVAIPASATLDQLRRLLVETQFSRVLVYQDTLDEVQGIAQGQSLLQIPEERNQTQDRP